jgi:hypothetical protein
MLRVRRLSRACPRRSDDSFAADVTPPRPALHLVHTQMISCATLTRCRSRRTLPASAGAQPTETNNDCGPGFGRGLAAYLSPPAEN